jgi:transcriptional regulator with XRE-family HTH domain
MKHFGSELHKIIERKNLKQKDVASMLKMTPMNLSKILRKKTIDASLLERFARVLNVSVLVFFDDDFGDPPVEDNLYVTNDGQDTSYTPDKDKRCRNCDRLEKMVDHQERIICRLEKEIEHCKV